MNGPKTGGTGNSMSSRRGRNDQIVCLNNVALVDKNAPDAAVDRRPDGAIGELKPAVLDIGFVRLDRGCQRVRVGAELVVLVLGHIVLLDQDLVPFSLIFGIFRLRRVPCQLCLGLLERGIVGTRVDLEEQVALFYILALFKMHSEHFSAYQCFHGNGIVCFNVADGGDLERNVLLRHIPYFHRHNPLSRLFRLAVGTSADEKGEQ